MLEIVKIKALISLLDDPDQQVWEAAMNELSNADYTQTQDLLHLLHKDIESVEQQERLQSIIERIRYQHIGKLINQWKEKGGKNLLEVMTYICQLRYPEVTESELNEKLEALRLDAWLEFHYDLTSFEKVKILNYILFQLHGFRGDEENFLHHDNSFLNKVLDNKKGNPISLSIVYMLVAQRLNVPIYGVNLPRHFIMAYVEDEETGTIEKFNDQQEITETAFGEIKFYINAYNGGGVFNHSQLKGILKEMQLDEKPEYMLPCSNSVIVLRVLMNLYNSYKSQEKEEAEYIDAIIKSYTSRLKA